MFDKARSRFKHLISYNEFSGKWETSLSSLNDNWISKPNYAHRIQRRRLREHVTPKVDPQNSTPNTIHPSTPGNALFQIMSQTIGAVSTTPFQKQTPQIHHQLTFNTTDQTCVLQSLASCISINTTPCSFRHSTSSSSKLTRAHSPFTRPPRLTHSNTAHGQTQTDIRPINRLWWLCRCYQLFPVACHRQETLSKEIL